MIGDIRTSRDTLLVLIRREPGLHLREIPRRLGISLGSARFHLAALAGTDSVVEVRHGRFVRWFPTDGLAPADFRLICALRIRRQREILLCMLDRGPCRFSEIRSATDIPSSALAADLRRLIVNGLVASRAGPQYELTDAPLIRRQVKRYRAEFPDLLFPKGFLN